MKLMLLDKVQLPFGPGEEVEFKSFTQGYRGAWFRCKIHNICTRRGSLQCTLEYCDFPDEKITWTSVYEAAQKDSSCQTQRTKELMLRPPFPPFHKKSEQMLSLPAQPPLAEVTTVVNDTWRVGDLVDLWSDGCYWSGKIIKLHADDSVEVELPGPPIGEGSIYKGVVRDLRPSLNWSQEKGWSVPMSQANQDSWYAARLVQCSPLALLHHDSDPGPVAHALDGSCILCVEARNGCPVTSNAASKIMLEWKGSSCSARGRGYSRASTDTSNSNSNTVCFPRNKSANEKGRAVVYSDEETGFERSGDLPGNSGISDRASTDTSNSNSNTVCFPRNKSSNEKRRAVVYSDEETGFERSGDLPGNSGSSDRASTDTSNSNSNTVRFPRNKSLNEKSRAVVSSDEETGSKRSGDLPGDLGSSDRASTDTSNSNSNTVCFPRNKSSNEKSRAVVYSDEETGSKRSGDLLGDSGSSDRASTDTSNSNSNTVCFPRNKSSNEKSRAVVYSDEETGSERSGDLPGNSGSSDRALTDTSNSNSTIVCFPRNKSFNEKSRAVVSSDEEIGSERSGDCPDDAGSSDRASTEKSKSDSLHFGRNHSSQKSRRAVWSEDEGEVGSVVRKREREGGVIETEIGESIMELEEVASKIRWIKGLLRFGFSSWLNPPSSTWKFVPNTDLTLTSDDPPTTTTNTTPRPSSDN